MILSLEKNDYSEADLVQIKVPVNLPYFTDQKEYARVDGAIELDGIQYNYVKRKICNDTLYLLCLPNQDKTRITDVKNNYAKEASDFPSGKRQSEPQGKKNIFNTDYNCIANPNLNIPLSPILSVSGYFIVDLPDYFIAVPCKPPESFG
ncbi:MAG TPA: hypothetical protein PKM63_16605 [Panacibacter sp.]|nr:hypothetical protein [Panacibacter sp.]HNP45914.1 hypothetical protein [Panacibacter sp.]